MLKVRIMFAREKPNHGILVHSKVVEGQPTARMLLTLPVGDRTLQFEINGYGSPYYGPADLIFTIAEANESIQATILDAVRKDEFLHLQLMSPAAPGEPRTPTQELE